MLIGDCHLVLCSPSVLDRLNALLEPGGVLTLDERGVVGGEIPVIIPHANFRYIHSTCMNGDKQNHNLLLLLWKIYIQC